MADPWQECMDYAVGLARKAGEVSINYLQIILFIERVYICIYIYGV